jgi:hypothetical protein
LTSSVVKVRCCAHDVHDQQKGTIMVPFLMMKALVAEREADQRRSLRPVPPKGSNEHTQRQRLGWLLVELGLRLASPQRAVDQQCCGCLA